MTLVIQIQNLNVWFNTHHILNDVNLDIEPNKINCIIGPSGSGKSTFIRGLNRINDEVNGFLKKGSILFKGANIYDSDFDVIQLRTKIGMVFQKPTVFPVSIAQNVLFGIQQHKKLSKVEKLELVEKYLKQVGLWQEVSHRLTDKASSLSIGQQQRLCIARTLAVEPEVLLLDEPTSALDPISTLAIEKLLLKLKETITIVFVTHNIPQANRLADNLTFMCDGKILETGSKQDIFKSCNPQTSSFLNNEICEC